MGNEGLLRLQQQNILGGLTVLAWVRACRFRQSLSGFTLRTAGQAVWAFEQIEAHLLCARTKAAVQKNIAATRTYAEAIAIATWGLLTNVPC